MTQYYRLWRQRDYTRPGWWITFTTAVPFDYQGAIDGEERNIKDELQLCALLKVTTK